MAAKFIYTEEKNLITIQTLHEDISEYENAEKLHLRILLPIFLNRNIQLITIQPQKNSIGFELPSPRTLKIDGTEILLNELSNCDTESLKIVNDSEEFNRGLLLIVSGKEPLDSLIKHILIFKNTKTPAYITFKSLIGFCNYDGNYLFLLNSPLKLEEVKSLKVE